MNEEQNPAQMPYSFYDKVDTEDYNKFMQSMEKPIQNLVNRLRGVEVVYDKEAREYKEVIKTRPMLNSAGINYVEGMLGSLLNPNLYMSAIKDGQAKRYTIGAKKQIGVIINRNRINWGITIDNIRPVISLLCSIVAFAISKAQSDKDFLENVMASKYLSQQAPRQESGPENFGF